MRGQPPPDLVALLSAGTGAESDTAWERFLAAYGDLILHIARAFGDDHDAVMDRYAFVLEQIRRDDFGRLRRYVADGRGRFTTWLVVVLRRMCLDEQRRRYGRARNPSSDDPPDEKRASRRRLADLIAAEVDIEQIRDDHGAEPEAALRQAELLGALKRELARLEPTDRLLLRLRYAHDLSVPEAARRLGLPTPFHGYRRLDRILATLRAALRRVGVEDATP